MTGHSSDKPAPSSATDASAESAPGPKMQIIKGIAVSPGIAIGHVALLGDDHRRMPRRLIAPAAVEREQKKLDDAIHASIEELTAVHARAKGEMGDEAAKIFLFHAGMLKDKSLIGPMRKMVETERVGAEYAVCQVLGQLADKFRAAPDSVFTTKVNDIDDLVTRLLNQLLGRAESRLAKLPHNSILLARDLTPSQAASFDRKRVIGFATDLGGRTGHTAIVARALGIPAVVGCRQITAAATDGASIILDGDRGIIILNPDAERLEEYHGLIKQRETFQLSLGELRDLPSVTTDGQRIELVGNIEFADEAEHVLELGGEGVGLYRTEFLYLTSKHEPSEEDHYKSYVRCVELMKGKPLTIRTMDLGADKYTQERAELPERNPFLGCRSIRYCLKNQPMFKRQLRALLRASAKGPIKIMFPLITSTGEFRQSKYIVNDVMEDLDEEGIKFDRNMKVGMMVEVPSAALLAETFAREVDFFSIGTNDLTQYTLAVDRTNETIAGMYNPAHPAVIRLIRDVVRAARRHDTPVSCCGESAGDPEYALLLVGMGLRTLSVSAGSIPQLKRLIRSVSLKQCEQIARQALSFDSETQISSYLRDRARKIVPDLFDGRTGE
ncbi:MAG: phosphoenolpyruvate--protein phosphotransferase [Phycisphaeraceae bacterium]|nr:phosphoenolpyruvate--protein phosphotransferase [Phycisphaeraceae bacterium]